MKARYKCSCGYVWEGAYFQGAFHAPWGQTVCPRCGNDSQIEWVNYMKWRRWFGEDPAGSECRKRRRR